MFGEEQHREIEQEQPEGFSEGLPETSYDRASRAGYQKRSSTFRGSGPGGGDNGFTYAFFALALIVFLIVLKLFYLQVIVAKSYSEAAESQRTNVLTINGKRGTIYDRNGNVLAISVECSDIYANPKTIEDASAVADALTAILGGEKSEYLELLQQETTFVYIERQVDQEVADALEEKLSEQELTGIYYLSTTKRVYPYGNSCAQILGYVNIDGEGVSGLEYYYNDILKGKDGEMILETDVYGDPIAGGASQLTEATNGIDIILSIDIDLQIQCEEIITEGVKSYKANSGATLVMDPTTGEIYAACSTPLPDFSDLSDSAALNLSLVSSSYEPGSIFKVITTSIGFEMGLFTTETEYVVPWRVLVGDNYVTDDDGRNYTMTMSVREILRRSSNCGAATLVQDVIGASAFAAGVDIFGIGQLTGIDFPGEIEGIIRSIDQYDGATAGSMAFGQSVAIPVIQIIRAYAAIANDGVALTPHFLIAKDNVEVEWPQGTRLISAITANDETSIMVTVMEEGTGVNGQIEGYVIAGKTGTGEQSATGEAYDAGYASSLMGFANADDPEVLVYAGLYNTPYLASASAAYVFQDVMYEALLILGINPVT